MISSIYADLNQMAKDLLAEFDGRTTKLQIVRTTGSFVSSVTGLFTPGTTSNIDVTGVVSPYKKSQKSEVDIQTGDLLLILDSQNEPLPDDKFLVDGRTYSTVAIERIKPSDVVLLYKVQIRQ